MCDKQAMARMLFSLTAVLASMASPAGAAISVGPSGTDFLTFETAPAVTEWSTRTIAGGGSDIWNAEAMDAAVQLLSAATINNALQVTATYPPSTSTAGARWNSSGHFLQTRPAGVAAHVLMAALRNDTGTDIFSLAIAYDFDRLIPPPFEEPPGLRAYYSLTGQANSWSLIPELTTDLPGSLTATVDLGMIPCPPDAYLYLLWADDNSESATDPAYTLDNFIAFSEGRLVALGVDGGLTHVLGRAITLRAAVFGPGTVTNVSFYADSRLLGSVAERAFSVIYSNAPLGVHELSAVAWDDLGNSWASATELMTVVPNEPPALVFTEPSEGASILVGSTVRCQAAVSDADGEVAQLDFNLDSVPIFAYGPVWTGVSPWFQMCDVTAGPHIIAAVTVDDLGARVTNSLAFTATNPPGVAVLLTNGSTWNYLVTGDAPPTAWRERLFDDTGWSNGVAELGYGDAGLPDKRPERTVISAGLILGTQNVTTYFRRSFVVREPAALTNLIVRLLRDDGGVVYINGLEVFRSNMTNGPISYSTLAASETPDDGTLYVETNIPPTVLVPGTNVVAVEIHQGYVGSYGTPDVSFDLMLWGQPGEPTLKVTRLSPSTVELSWPFPPSDYVLRSKPHLGALTWDPVPEPDNPSGGLHRVIVDTSAGTRFFRLEKP